jgi:5'-nucleotidase
MNGTWPRGIRCCPHAPVSWEEHYHKEVSSNGDAVYYLDGRLPDLSAAPDTDMALLRDGYVTVTPLCGDMTDRSGLNPLATRNWPNTFA